MTAPIRIVSDDEQRRLDECVREPIRTPGSVQPHGALIAIDPLNREMRYTSDNAEAIFGRDPASLLGQPLSHLVGSAWIEEFSDSLNPRIDIVNPLAATIDGRRFDVIVNHSGELVLLEFEPSIVAEWYQSIPAVYSASHRLTKATTRQDLWEWTARELRTLTHFDRVMIYHFHPDDHGEIVAEEAAEGMEPYLGLHFPASDIPSQARDLYLTKLSRMIVDSSGETSAILGIDGTGLDLSTAELRSVSPYHLQFMRNMGQASTLSLSLIHDGALIGMITLASRTPHRVPFVLRQGLEVLANQVALQLNSMDEIGRLTRQMHLRSVRSRLVAQMLAGELSDSPGIGDAILTGEMSILDLIPAAGAVLRLDGVTMSIGDVPTEAEAAAVFAAAMEQTGGTTFASDALALEFPLVGHVAAASAGLITVPIGTDGDYLAWFRPEITQTIAWLGDLSVENRDTPLSPRTSFSSWSQSVSGRSAPWGGLETEAEELSRDLVSAMLRRAEEKLANLALFDPLTGLPNRRLLMDRLNQSLARYARGVELAVLFIDLDGFKSINDSLGHDAGDAMLVHAARQIAGTIRTQDTVARLGGDEYVVLCENTTREEADVVADRVVDAIRVPTTVGDKTIVVTASVGIAVASFNFSATELLREADAAMYRAKQKGRDGTSH